MPLIQVQGINMDVNCVGRNWLLQFVIAGAISIGLMEVSAIRSAFAEDTKTK